MVKYFLKKAHGTKAFIIISLIIMLLVIALPVAAVPVSLPKAIQLNSYVVRMDVEGQAPEYFSEIRFVGTENEVIESRNTNSNGRNISTKVPGKFKISNVELKHALSSDMMLSEWRQKVVDGDMQNARKNVTIYIYDSSEVSVIAQWDMVNAWPSGLISGVDDKSSGKLNEIVTIVCDEIKRIK